MTNEIVNQNTNELPITNNTNTDVIQTADGKYKRIAKYDATSSILATTREEKIKLAQLFGGDDDTVLTLRDLKGKVFFIKDVITQPYESVDEETGEITNGVVTYIFTLEGEKIVTSSKSVYFKWMNQIKSVFGDPTYENEEKAPKVEVVEKKSPLGRKYNDLKLIL